VITGKSLTNKTRFSRPPEVLKLANDEIHVWRASFEQPAEHIRQLASVLSANERSRAERFRFERDRRTFTIGRGVLRVILGHYIGIEPGQVQFRYGPYGKPYLAQELERSALRFNLAHSHELALYAFARGREIGVDLERVRPMPDAEQIAARFFSARENRALQALPQAQKIQAFFNCWTCKEAYLKASGEGLARPLDTFDVSLVPGEATRLLYVKGQPEEIDRWSFKTFVPAADHLATLAVEGLGWQTLYLDYG